MDNPPQDVVGPSLALAELTEPIAFEDQLPQRPKDDSREADPMHMEFELRASVRIRGLVPVEIPEMTVRSNASVLSEPAFSLKTTQATTQIETKIITTAEDQSNAMPGAACIPGLVPAATSAPSPPSPTTLPTPQDATPLADQSTGAQGDTDDHSSMAPLLPADGITGTAATSPEADPAEQTPAVAVEAETDPTEQVMAMAVATAQAVGR